MIKLILKQNDVTLTEFANVLNISRPTLDSYIDLYDDGQTLKNQTYQKAFDFLFDNPMISENQFCKRYNYVKDFFGSKQESFGFEEKNESLSHNKNDERLNLIFSKLKENIRSNPENQKRKINMLKKINILLLNDLDYLESFLTYYLHVYGYRDITELDEQEQKQLANTYYFEQSHQNKNISIDDDKFKKFIDFCKKNFNSKNKIIKKIKGTLDEKITKLINEELDNYTSFDQIDYESFIKKIKESI